VTDAEYKKADDDAVVSLGQSVIRFFDMGGYPCTTLYVPYGEPFHDESDRALVYIDCLWFTFSEGGFEKINTHAIHPEGPKLHGRCVPL